MTDNKMPKRDAMHVSELPKDVLDEIINSKVPKEHCPEYQSLRESHDRLLKDLKEYYIPQLEHNMKSHREFALQNGNAPNIAHLHHGYANAYEVAVGCMKEAIAESEKLQEGK